MNRARRLFSLALLAAGLFLAGCGNDPNPAPFREKRADGSPWLVRYAGLSDDPRSFDPQFMYDQMSRRVLEAVYDTLLEYHPMKTDPYEVRPGLLAELPRKEMSPEGKVSYLCRLKPEARFHDDVCFPGGKGRPVTAQDVHYGFLRLCDPKVESPFLSNFTDYLPGLQQAHDAAEKSGKFDYEQKLPAIEVVDAQTFRLHLTKPYPQILYWLAMHCTAPVAREAVEYYDGKKHGDIVRPDFHKYGAVGTGPFRIREYVPRQRVRLERVEGYATTKFPSDGFPPEKAEWLQTLAGKALPLVDEVHFSIIRENIPIFILTRQGYLDGMGINKDAFGAMVTASRELAPKYRERGMRLEKDVEPSTFWISFNLDDPVLGPNPKLRQALSAAYDAQTYSDIFYDSVAPVAEQLIPPGLYGHQRDWKNPYGFDLEKAQRLIAEAGYPGGIDPKTGRPLELLLEITAVGSEDRQRAEFEQRCFERIGVRVRVSENTFARLLQKQDTGDFQMASGTGWGADYPDPENFFFLLYSKNVPPAGKNITRYKNPEFDRLFEQMATMESGPERLEIVGKMTALVAEDCPQILNFHKAFYTAVQPWAPRTHNNLMLEGGVKYAVVDAELRARKRIEWNRKPLWPIALLVGLLLGGAAYAIRLNRRRNV
ncbi:MAG TPA: ABC transporter substrate-binding protein [Chthoniobacteraceae bacterium]|jgi:ABC-type transport system substrate-binding protein